MAMSMLITAVLSSWHVPLKVFCKSSNFLNLVVASIPSMTGICRSVITYIYIQILINTYSRLGLGSEGLGDEGLRDEGLRN
jgi:hypothetical protein